jgi:hypothetical protein
MATLLEERAAAGATRESGQPTGTAAAAFLAAAIGSFGMGLIMILSESGLVSIPALYEPAGGVTGRTTLAVVVWLAAWAILHFRWRGRDVSVSRLAAIIAVLIGLGILGTFPPVWGLL